MGRLYLRTIFFLGSLVFLSRNAGELTHQLERAFGLLSFAVFCLTYLEPRLHRPTYLAVPFGAIVLAAGVLAVQNDAPSAVAALALATLGLWFLAEGSGVAVDDLPVFVLTAIGFDVLLLAGKLSPPLWYGSQGLARAACWVSNTLGGQSLNFRPTFAGLPTTALLLLFWTARWLYGAKRRWQELAWPAGLTLLVQVLYLLAAARALDVFLPAVNEVAGRADEQLTWRQAFLLRSLPWNLPFALFLLNLPVLLWGVGRRLETEGRQRFAAAQLVVPLAGLVALLAFVGIISETRRRDGRPVVFYEKGFLNWESPKWGQYGSMSAGMFGNLPRFLESLGLAGRRTPELTSASLSNASAAVIINLDHALPPASMRAIWHFVDHGGTLLVLADHTAWDSSGTVHVNNLLAPAAIKVHLDSAICPVGGWLHCYDFMWHPLTAGVGDERNEPGIVVGASLHVRWPARPVVLGRYGFEDRGNSYRKELAYLGNMRFDPDEPLGDTVLVAEQDYGRGRVMVFGDTSSFVNGIVTGSHQFVGNVFWWLVAPAGSRAGVLGVWLGLVFLAAAAVLFAHSPSSSGALLLVALALVAMCNVVRLHKPAALQEPPRGDVAYLDTAHFPLVSLEGARDNGLMGLELNLMRNGLLPFALDRFTTPALARARLLVFVAPMKRFSRDDVRTVLRYLENGGTVILSVGAEESYGCQPLLDALDLAIDGNMPLGVFSTRSPVVGQEAMFWKAWALKDLAKGKTLTPSEITVVAGHEEFPVILVKPFGNGRMVLIGDSDFLTGKNLEGDKSYNEVNINFLKALLEYLGVAAKK